VSGPTAPVRSRVAAWLGTGVLVAGLALTLVTTWRLAGEGKPLSPVDEIAHADTSFKVHRGTYPYRGADVGQPLVDTWTCYAGHQSIPWQARCGSAKAVPARLPQPTGSLTTGYIHYPTYFVAGEAFRRAHDVAAGEARWEIDTYRRFAAVVFVLGMALCAVVARRLGLGPAGQVAAAFIPVAAPSVLVYSSMVNPMSAAVACGALVAGAGLRWMITGRGFGWVAAATAASAAVAVTASLPAGVLLVAVLLGLVLRMRGRRLNTPWEPRWWHAAVLAALLVGPILAYGLVIDARSTVDNATLYAPYARAGWEQVALGVWAEVFASHLPWVEDGSLVRPDLGTVRNYVRGAGVGMPLLVTATVAGGLVAGATGALRRTDPPVVARRATATAPGASPDRPPVRVLQLAAVSALLGLLAYPPLLRLLNAINVGIDYPIVSRYSISLAPFFVLVVLLLARDHPWFARVMATIGVVAVAAWCVTAW
jgi:hypothetical protein